MENSSHAIFFTWSEKGIIGTGDANNKQRFEITNIKLYVPVVILSTQDNEKNLLQQLKTGFRRTIHWNNYQSEPTI